MAEPEQEPLQPGGGGDDQKTNQHVRFDPKGYQHQQQQAQYSAEKPDIATRAIDQHTYYINIPIHPLSGQVPDEHLERLSLYFSTYGIVLILVGVAAILVPLFFGFPIDQLFAWLLVVAGAVTLLNFLLVCGAPGTTSFLLLGALHLGVGLWMLLQPVPNPTMLIFLIAGWFLVHGVLKLLMTCQLRYLTTWPAVMISGLTSIILAFTILALSSWLFNESLKVIGIFFGADLCLTGVSMMLIAFMARLGHKAKETHKPLLAESARVAATV